MQEWVGDEVPVDRDPLGALRSAVALIADVDLSVMADAAIAADVVALRRSMDRLDGVFAAWTLGAQGRGVGLADGHSSMPAWLGWRTGMRRGAVNSVIRNAEAADLLEESGGAWRAGEISSGAMEAIASARVDGHDDELRACERELLDLARRGDHASLRRAAGHVRNLARADGTEPADRDGLTLGKLLDGRTVINGELSGTKAEAVRTAMQAFMDPASDRDGRTAAQRRADALVRICEVAIKHGTAAGRAKAHISFVVDWDTFNDVGNDDGPGFMDGMFTGPIHRRDIERLLCDGVVSRVVMGPDSLPLDVGRASQTWPAGIRRAIVVRDRGCRWPGCDVPAGWCDAHHWVHWTHGGRTALDNGFLLCSRHHHFLHRHPEWTVTFDDQIVRVFRPNGQELERYPWAETTSRIDSIESWEPREPVGASP